MNILKYFLWFLIISSFSVLGFAQEDIDSEPEPESFEEELNDTLIVEIPVQRFVRVGFDVSALVRNYLEPEVQYYEFSLDSEVYKNVFVFAEGGFMGVQSERDNYAYTASGYFGRLGGNYNFLRRTHESQKDLVLLGLAYGYGFLSHDASFFRINNPYWGEYTGNVDEEPFYLHWLELRGGLKTEIFNNFFMGWTLKTRIRLNSKREIELSPYYVGGYGHYNKTSPVSLQFHVLYKIPF